MPRAKRPETEREKTERTLYEAIEQGDLDTLRHLYDQGLPRLFSASRPLHAAVWTDTVGTLSLLLQKGEDINGCDAFGNSPLCEAVLGGHLKAIRFLLQEGADPHVFSYDWMNASIPVPGSALLRQTITSGFNWFPNQPERVARLSSGLACLLDCLPALLPEWDADQTFFYGAYKSPEKERQLRLLLVEALQGRGRNDLAAMLVPSADERSCHAP